ncbi:stage III sporulation protein AB [Anaeromassilibacillus sp. Marseille-P3371]|uniref:stage III sporulation protein AB n=1 Tax=Anaeromassilibacillus sp. Marseille-P3371 TaxID=1944639 RepID=UPI001301B3AF|nr:stage III sporulation protein AB [Anaeromassilibacillus sp. Marseille-P3371]
MLKVLGILLLIAAGTIAGYVQSHRLSQRVQQLEEMLRFLNAAQTEIRYSAASVAEIVQRHGRSLAFLQECAAHCEEGEDFHTAWKKGVQAGSKGTGLTEADRLLLSDFGDGFGASDVEGQLSHCRLYTELFSDRLENARSEKTRKGKLYLMLGSFSGIAVALFLC